MKKILTISATECSGTSGVTADAKIITAHKHYATSVTTCITAQNSTGLYGVFDVEPDFVSMQLNCIFSDYPPDAIKVGVVLSTGNIREIIQCLNHYKPKNVVIDPSILTNTGDKLLMDNATDIALELLNYGDVITPNIMDAELITGIHVETKADMVKTARIIQKKYNNAVILKGAHMDEGANDFLCMEGHEEWLLGERYDVKNQSGTGNAFSCSITCYLAEGLSITEAIKKSKEFVNGALINQLENFGKADGPINTLWNL